MIKVELITITGCGTRSVEKYLTDHWKFGLNNFPWKDKELADRPMSFNSTHFQPDRKALDRLLNEDNTIILSTWRDPLRTVIHNLYKGRKKIMHMFPLLMELRRAKPVIMIDLRCIPYTEGEGEVLRPVGKVANDNYLRQAYFNKDIEYIEKTIGKGWEDVNLLGQLREFNFEDLPTDDWWH